MLKDVHKYFLMNLIGKTLNYYPDFQIDNIIYEVKGYQDEKAKVKHQLFPQVQYFNKDKMKDILKYVKTKYGKNYIQLLQTKP